MLTTIDHLLVFLSRPVVLSALTLAFGSYLLTRFTERRAKRDKIREKALQLLEDVGNELNSVISIIYGHIRTSQFEIQKDSPVNEKRSGLFIKRFSVRIRSQVFLESDEFWQRYDQLTFEIDKIVRLMGTLSANYDLAEVAERIKQHQMRFAASWPFDERSTHSKYPPPSDELVIWADMVWDRSVSLLTSNLNSVVR